MDPVTEGFEAIHASYRPRIVRYLTRLVGPDAAEDLAQEVFLKVSRGLPDFQGTATLSTWIYRIATNAATDRVRSKSFRQARSDKGTSFRDGSAEDADALPDDRNPSLERQLMRDQMSSCVHDFIGALPTNYRAVVILSDIEGLSNQEIADVLDLSLDTVKIRLHRGRAQLRKKLNAGCQFDRDEDNVLVCDPKAGPGRSE